MRFRSFAIAALLAVAAVVLLFVTAERSAIDGRLLFGLWHAREIALVLLLGILSAGFAAAALSRELLLGYLFSLVLGAFTLMLLEGAGQMGWVSYADLMGNPKPAATAKATDRQTPGIDLRGEAHQDTAYAWGLPHEKIPYRYLTDRYGFRNPSDPGSADIYLVGDSILVGGLVPFERTLTARLSEVTDRTVMNVALVGLSPQEEHEIFWKADLPLEGRLVLQFLFEGNDLLDSSTYRVRGNSQAVPEPSAFDKSFLENAVLALQRWSQPVVGLAKRRTCRIDGQDYTFKWTHESHQGVEAEQEEILGAVKQFAERVEQGGGRFGLVYVPAKLRVLGPACDSWPPDSDLRDIYAHHPFPDAVQRFAEENQIPWIDLSADLIAAARTGDIPWFWGDTHWNESGHAIATRSLAASALLEKNRSPVAAQR